MTEPAFCVCDRRKKLRCAFHSAYDSERRRATPEGRYHRPLTGQDMSALFVMWFALFSVVVASAWIFRW